MDIFISSVITGFERYREAATKAIESLGHKVVRAEDFGASPDTPQQVCLAGIRASDLVVLILGERYGFPQRSGLSATHEEYLEARDGKDPLVFVQKGITAEPAQQKLIKEVQGWASGRFTESFATPEELRDAVTRAIHQLQLSRLQGRAEEAEMLARARQEIPGRLDEHGYYLWLVITGGPRQQVLRPAEMEKPQFTKNLKQLVLLDDDSPFNSEDANQSRLGEDKVTLTQGKSRISIDEIGTIRIVQPAMPAMKERELNWNRAEITTGVVIAEEVQERIESMLRFGGKLLDLIDPTKKLTHVVPILALFGANYTEWRTRAQHRANPNSASMHQVDDKIEVIIPPDLRNRAVLTVDAAKLAEDMTVRLRRLWKK